MAGGFVVNGKCLDALHAPDIYFSAIPPSISNTSYTYTYKTISGIWNIKSLNPKNNIVSFDVPLIMPNLSPCLTQQSFLDGAALGLLIGTSMVVVSVWAMLRRAV